MEQQKSRHKLTALFIGISVLLLLFQSINAGLYLTSYSSLILLLGSILCLVVLYSVYRIQENRIRQALQENTSVLNRTETKDLSEQKETLDQLSLREYDLEYAQRLAKIGNWSMDIRTGQIKWSKEMYRIFGLEEDSFEISTEQHYLSFIHPSDLPKHRLISAEVMRTQKPFNYEVRIVRHDAQIRYLCVQGEFVMGEGEEELTIFGVTQDITERKLAEIELQMPRTHLQSLTDHLNVVALSLNMTTGKISYLSQGVDDMFGVSRKEFKDNLKVVLNVVHPEDKERVSCVLRNVERQQAELSEFRIIHGHTGEIRWIQTQSMVVSGGEEDDSFMYCLCMDITSRKLPENIMQEQNEVLSMVALGSSLSEVLHMIALKANAKLPNHSCSIVLMEEETGKFINGASPSFPEDYINQYIRRMNTHPAASPIGYASYLKKNVIVSDIPNDSVWKDSSFVRSTKAYGLGSCWIYPILSSDEKLLGICSFYSIKTGSPRAIESGMIEGFVNMAALCIERKEKDKEIHKLAFFDALTGLGNRRYIMDHLQQRVDENENAPFALFFIDLDQFKIVNDSLGHDMGDLLLLEVANRLKSCAREMDLVGRLGGDEFIMVISNVQSEKKAVDIAGRIMASLALPIMLDRHEVRITPSIGISFYPLHGRDMQSLMKFADAAMHQVKIEGRNSYKIYESSLDKMSKERFAIRSEFHQALSSQEFMLYYQPRVELAENRVKGVEALIRWNHPQRGMIPPLDFIPLAEETGFISTLGEWVLWEACRQNKEWQDQGFAPVRVAVNVSAQQFRQKGFVGMVFRTLQEVGLEAKWLEIEITESALMNDEEQMVSILSDLEKLGVYVSIDDFGTGYSSLSYLKRFKVNALKIDQSFIRGLPGDHEDAAITTTIISLAQNLGLQVTAEGVESKEQVDFLGKLKCDSIQGYFYGRPQPPQDVVKFFNKEFVEWRHREFPPTA